MNSDEYLKMQETAANRVRDMQRKANSYSAPPKEHTEEAAKPSAPPTKKGKGAELLKMLNLNSIGMDSDRALIAAMMLLLVSESDDELLVLALLYVML